MYLLVLSLSLSLAGVIPKVISVLVLLVCLFLFVWDGLSLAFSSLI